MVVTANYKFITALRVLIQEAAKKMGEGDKRDREGHFLRAANNADERKWQREDTLKMKASPNWTSIAPVMNKAQSHSWLSGQAGRLNFCEISK